MWANFVDVSWYNFLYQVGKYSDWVFGVVVCGLISVLMCFFVSRFEWVKE
jgi:hypothetical protein